MLIGGKNASLGEMYSNLTSYPEMAEYLVGLGIDSLSLSLDLIIKIITVIDEFEKSLPTS